MAQQGPNSGGTLADDATVGDIVWTNPGNAISSNDIYAVFSTGPEGGVSHYLKATNFGFSIPTGSTINGILVEIEAKRPAGTAGFDNVRIVKGGTISATNKTSPLTTTEEYRSVGGATDLWGETWTAADINATTFGVVAGNITYPGGSTASVDHIRITVYYTEVIGGSSLTLVWV